MAENSDHALEFTNSQEQLELSALINRFCDRDPKDFNPDTDVDEARKIVHILDPKMELTKEGHYLERLRSDTTSSSTIVGTTEFGEFQTTVGRQNEKGPKVTSIGTKPAEYRIGSYVVTKQQNPRGPILTFKHFMRHGRTAQMLGQFPPFWGILYNPDSLEPIGILDIHTQVKEKIFKLPFLMKKGESVRRINQHADVVWRVPDK